MLRNHNKTTALMAAAMAILLCIVSITGATLALFTSNTTDGTIGINATSGDLSVDIVDTSVENPSSLVGDVLDFITTAEQDKVLFEPGAVYQTEGFRVKNNGNIPINYILYISEDDSVAGDFADAFEVYLTNAPAGRGTMVKLQEFKGRLEVEQSSEVFYLVVYMKETAGNEFQDRTFTGIGITVCAVQGNVNID